jgi:hypothetical protein
MRKTPTPHHRQVWQKIWKKCKQLNAVQASALCILCAVGAFTLGMETAGKVHPFSLSEAAVMGDAVSHPIIKGDIDGNGTLDIRDAIAVLEFAEHLANPTPEQVQHGDADGDYQLTGKDALRILHTISAR